MQVGLPIQWRIGGLLFGIGGLLSLIGAAVFNFGPQAIGSPMTVAGAFLEGAALVTISFAFASERVDVWARWLLFAVGVLVLLEFVISVIPALAVDVPGDVLIVLYVLLAAALLIAAIRIYRSVPAGRAVRWALLPAALFQAADCLLLLAGHGGEWWTLAGLGLLYVLAGVIFVSYRPSRTSQDAPIRGQRR